MAFTNSFLYVPNFLKQTCVTFTMIKRSTDGWWPWLNYWYYRAFYSVVLLSGNWEEIVSSAVRCTKQRGVERPLRFLRWVR